MLYMARTFKVLLWVVVGVVIVAGVLLAVREDAWICTSGGWMPRRGWFPGGTPSEPVPAMPCPSSLAPNQYPYDPAAKADLIRVMSPAFNSVVTSPLTVTGEARGGWYFEASFPVQLLDSTGAVIAQVPAQTISDWMTDDFVPFSVTLEFAPQPPGSTGMLVLKKDNPSGLPENEDQVRIPIRF